MPCSCADTRRQPRFVTSLDSGACLWEAWAVVKVAQSWRVKSFERVRAWVRIGRGKWSRMGKFRKMGEKIRGLIWDWRRESGELGSRSV